MVHCNHCHSPAAKPLFTAKGFDLVECSTCGLAYVANPPSTEALAQIYSGMKDYHFDLQDENSLAYERIARIAGNHLAFLRQVPGAMDAKGALLDVGCSTGQFLAAARGEGFDVRGLELSIPSARFARSTYRLSVDSGSFADCRLPAGSQQVITMFDVIEHVPDPAADLARAWKLLRPGGWLVLSTPNIDGWFPRLSYRLAHALNYWPHPEPPHHLFQFSVRTLGAMLARAGFVGGPVAHRNIDLAYSFGTPETLMKMPKRALYAALFAPVAKLAPLFQAGDWFYIAAQKPVDAAMPVDLPVAA